MDKNMLTMRRKLYTALRDFHEDREFARGIGSYLAHPEDMQTMLDFLQRKKKPTVREVVLLATELDFERRYQIKLIREEDDLVIAWMCIAGRRRLAKEERKRQRELRIQREAVQMLKEALMRGEAVLFVYRGEASGISSVQTADGMTFIMWYGYRKKLFDHIDELMTDSFFDGCSLEKLAGTITFEIVKEHA